jgi:hypothetical protein|tara:strand:+ start:1059 stop:1232 length:174 start_codon:yes stop_codon:yes gene_type:complete
MKNTKIDELNKFLEENEEGTVCDIDGNCRPKLIKPDKSIVERISKKIIIEDGRQLLM